MNRIAEKELILPALYLMSIDAKGKITTPTLIKKLTEIMHPTGIDAQILANRKDTYFSQKVRNLKSHDTLKRDGWATYNDGSYTITQKGRHFVEDNIDNILYLLNTGFKFDDLRNSFGEIASNPKRKIIHFEETISEGISFQVKTHIYNRSRKLHEAAIDHFTHNGHIICDCCGFDFHKLYSPAYKCDCIEIHHIKPIFQYADNEMLKTIQDALTNLLPVCPNCHRVIHRNNIDRDGLADMKKHIINTRH